MPEAPPLLPTLRFADRLRRPCGIAGEVMRVALMSLLTALLAVGCGSTAAPEPAPSVGDLDPSVFDIDSSAAGDAAPATREKEPAVTHLGREVLPGAGLVVLGRTRSLSNALGGVEVARFEVTEVLRSVPWDRVPDTGDTPVLTVFCGEPGMLPRAGNEAVLLVARRPRSPNHDVVQVIDVTGREGPQRLEAVRTYVEIEDIVDDEERVNALLDYLRRAVRDSRKWTRSNAALEYGSLARARPGDLGGDDASVLRAAALGAGESDVRIAIQTALAVAERNTRAPPRIAIPVETPGETDTARLDTFVERYLSTNPPLERRQVVLDCAVALEADATPLLRRALADVDPRVREAAIAAAGELRIRSLGPDLVPLLARDEPLPVRQSLVRALGYVREPTAVPTLQAVARGSSEIGEAACYALARIRDEAAVAALGELLAHASATRSDLLVFLLTDEFVEQEARLGRPIED